MNQNTKHAVSGFKCVTFIVVTHKKNCTSFFSRGSKLGNLGNSIQHKHLNTNLKKKMWGSKVHGGERLILICEGLELCMCLEFIIDLDFEGLRTC
jgi:hypothetical protein